MAAALPLSYRCSHSKRSSVSSRNKVWLAMVSLSFLYCSTKLQAGCDLVMAGTLKFILAIGDGLPWFDVLDRQGVSMNHLE